MLLIAYEQKSCDNYDSVCLDVIITNCKQTKALLAVGRSSVILGEIITIPSPEFRAYFFEMSRNQVA